MENTILFDLFLYIILLVKIVFITYLLLKINATRNNDKVGEDKYSKQEAHYHNIFTFLMGVLILIIFDPISYPDKVCVSGRTKQFIYIFGLLSITSIFHEIYHTQL